MTKTNEEINQVMQHLKKCGMLDKLTEGERETIRRMLNGIAYEAVHEVYNQISNLMFNNQNEVKP
jgi:hypothetical protein